MDENKLIQECDGILQAVARSICKQFPACDYEEVLQEAWIAGLLTLRKFDGRGNLHGWMYYATRRRLVTLLSQSSVVRERLSKPQASSCYNLAGLNAAAERVCFRLGQLLAEVSHDAAGAIMLAVNYPRSVSNTRKLEQYLTAAGWDEERIQCVITEVREALP